MLTINLRHCICIHVCISGTPGTTNQAVNIEDDLDDDLDLLQSPFLIESVDNDPVNKYRKEFLRSDVPPLRVFVDRIGEEFASDVLAIYKKPNSSFCSSVRVSSKMKELWEMGQFENSLAFLWKWYRMVFHWKNPKSHLSLKDKQTISCQSQMPCYAAVGFSSVLGG